MKKIAKYLSKAFYLVTTIFSCLILFSCAKTIDELDLEVSKKVETTAKKIMKATETIDVYVETTESIVEEIEGESESFELNEEMSDKIVETATESIVESIEKSDVYVNASKHLFQSSNVPCSEANVVDLALWKYGRTPAEWVYVMPNTQLLSNSSPNKSSKFGYKVKASSGPKGCYMVVFTSCDELKGVDYDGRMYCFEDYTKIPYNEIRFNNGLDELKYGEYSVIDLLNKRYTMTNISKGVYMIGDVYVNVIYVDELDDIIKSYS